MTTNLGNPRYPLGKTASNALQAGSGRPLPDISMDAVLNKEISADDLRISAETLTAQAEISRKAGFERLAKNLLRAAELTRVANADLLKMYEALRPNRSTYGQLLELANRIEAEYQAPHTAGFIREAADVYRNRGLLK